MTDNETDVALAGNGFFAIAFTNKAGETSVKYTRDGAFTVNTEGYLVTKDGDYVLNQAGAQNTDPNARIRLNPNAKITIDELGNIYQNDQLVTRIASLILMIIIIFPSMVRICMILWMEDRSQLLMQRCSRGVSKALM